MPLLSSLAAGLTTLSATAAICADHGLLRRAGQRLDTSIDRGPSTQPFVALTFDDGPTPQTLSLLQLLRRHSVRATFFQCGKNVEQYPEIACQVHAAGHEIGNHGYSHTHLSPRLGPPPHLPSIPFIHRELARTQRLLTLVCGAPPRLFRAPYGQRWLGLHAVERQLGLRGIQWTVIGHDWEWPAPRIAQHILTHTVPGAILCLHDGRDVQPDADLSQTLQALETIIPAIRNLGLNFTTVTELLAPTSDLLPVPFP